MALQVTVHWKPIHDRYSLSLTYSLKLERLVSISLCHQVEGVLVVRSSLWLLLRLLQLRVLVGSNIIRVPLLESIIYES